MNPHPHWITLAIGLIVCGCATTPKSANPIFFPPAPAEPRVQYLKSFGQEADLGGQSRFAEFVLGGTTREIRPIWKPYGITTSKGKIHICDTMPGNVGTVDIARKKISYLRPTGPGALGLPLSVAVDTDGTQYVTDMKRRQVLIYDNTGKLLSTIGTNNEMRPCGIAIDPARLYVTDLRGQCVNVYNKTTREHLFTIPRPGADPHAILRAPTNIALDPQGRIYISDTGDFTVHVYDADGKHLRTLGQQGLNPGRFALPKGIAVDRAGRVYVVDAATAVVQMFDDQGQLLMWFGEPKTSGEAGLYLPACVAIDYDNVDLFQDYAAPGHRLEFLILVTNQAGPNKVSIFGFLKKNE